MPLSPVSHRNVEANTRAARALEKQGYRLSPAGDMAPRPRKPFVSRANAQACSKARFTSFLASAHAQRASAAPPAKVPEEPVSLCAAPAKNLAVGRHGTLFFDLETTGLLPKPPLDMKCGEIVQIGYALDDGPIHTRILKGGVRSHPAALKLHGITEKQRALGKDPHHVISRFMKRVGKAQKLCSYNTEFDVGFLRFVCRIQGIDTAPLNGCEIVCAMRVAAPVLKLSANFKDGYRSPSLVAAADHYDIPYDLSLLHSATEDVRILREVYRRLPKLPKKE